MSYNNDGLTEFSVLEHGIESLLDLMLRLSVQSTGCFVEKKNLWLSDERSCDGNSLLLTSRQFDTSLTNKCVISLREDVLVLDKGKCIGLSACLI